MKKREKAIIGKDFYRSYALDARALNEEERSIDLSFSSEEPVKRYGYNEILLHDEKSVVMDRIKSLGSVLFNHDPDRIIGRPDNIRMEGKKLRAKIFFDDDEESTRIMNKVKSGSLKGVSVGYRIHEIMVLGEKDTWKEYKGPADIATKWEPFEISLTPIPADSSVGVGRSLNQSEMKEDEMDKQEVMDIFKECLRDAGLLKKEDVETMIRTAVEDNGKPVFKIGADVFTGLMGRAAAISPEAKLKVADMAAEGRSEQEIVNSLLDMKITRDAVDPNKGEKGDGTRTDKGEKEEDGKSFKTVSDDDFFRSLTSPSIM